MVSDRTIFDEPHYQSLELLAAAALRDGNAAAAFKFADRRCRILPLPEPHCYVLRGEAAFKTGARDAAIADLAKALEIAPDNIDANRRMLAWADGAQRKQAAFALIGQERQFDALRKAVQVLHDEGVRQFANIDVLDDAIEGWAVWDHDVPLELSIADDGNTVSTSIKPDAFHPLAEFGQAASFQVTRPRSSRPQLITLCAGESVIHSRRAARNGRKLTTKVIRPRAAGEPDHPVTVIVPVYGDYEATRLCIDALREELKTSRHRAVIVDDATPDPRIARYVAKLKTQRVEVLVNPRNLGFIGTVNRALDHVRKGDVILLNSDTIVPRGFIDRLGAAARISPDIGTVMPLSNHGEFASFPLPNEVNPLPGHEDIQRIDAIAAEVNSGKVVDVPSGIGFCLYITRACLDLTGSLSDDFGSGYLEDADFCLRARAFGFRNVCAPSVYVGHAGSKSFGEGRKRSLVVQNLRLLERRFPDHRAECGAFMVADPLRPAREAIERKAVIAEKASRLLVTGAGVVGTIARERARQLVAQGQTAIILEIRHSTDGLKVAVIDAGKSMPQSIAFNLSVPGEDAGLLDFFKAIRPSGIEIFDPANTPLSLLEPLLALNIPYDIFIADAGLFAGRAPHRLAALPQFLHGPGASGADESWRPIAAGAQRILVPDGQAEVFAEVFAANLLPRPPIEKLDFFSADRKQAARATPSSPAHLAFVPARSCAEEHWLMREVARRLADMQPGMSFSVIGSTLDDMALMRASQAFVTGAIKTEEFDHVVEALGVNRLFVSTTRPLFGHPMTSAALSSGLPTAYFDWSAEPDRRQAGNLAIDAGTSIDFIADALNEWTAEP